METKYKSGFFFFSEAGSESKDKSICFEFPQLYLNEYLNNVCLLVKHWYYGLLL